VYTAICLLCRERGFLDLGTEVTRVRFRPLTAAEIAAYAERGVRRQGGGVRGAGAGMLLIDRVAGSFSNVVGLPMTRVVTMLARARLIRVTRTGPAWYAFAEGSMSPRGGLRETVRRSGAGGVVRDRIADAVRRSGRPAGSVKLVAVSKTSRSRGSSRRTRRD